MEKSVEVPPPTPLKPVAGWDKLGKDFGGRGIFVATDLLRR